MDAPERMWIFPKKGWFNAGASTHRIAASGARDLEYIRADLVPQWQPIETAPKAGTWVMLYESNGYEWGVDCTHWLASMNLHGEWVDQDDCLVVRHPTHWMPLPEAPTT